MNCEGTKQSKPYSRPVSGPENVSPIIKQQDPFEAIPDVILNYMQKALRWLIFPQKETSEGHSRGESSAATRTAATIAQNHVCEPGEKVRHIKLSGDAILAMDDAEREGYRCALRDELLASLEHPENEDELTLTPMVKPQKARETPKAAEPQATIKPNRSESLPDHAEQTDDEGLEGYVSKAEMRLFEGQLSKEELRLLARIRRVTEWSKPKPKRGPTLRPEMMSELRASISSPYTVARSFHEEGPASKRESKPLETILPYNKEYRRRKKPHETRYGSSDYAMDSEDSNDDDGHARNGCTERGRRHSDSSPHTQKETQTEETQVPSRQWRHFYRQEHEEDHRSSHGGLQFRSHVIPKRHVRPIEGRYSALDTDDEEEAVRKMDIEQAPRKAQQKRSGTQGSASKLQPVLPSDANWQQGQPDYYEAPNHRVPPQIYPTLCFGRRLIVHHQRQHTSHGGLLIRPHVGAQGYTDYSGVPNYRLPPQIYPTLQYGRRSRLYHPKLDEILEGTSSGLVKPLVLDTWRCGSCDHRTSVVSSACDRCDAPKPRALAPTTNPVLERLIVYRPERTKQQHHKIKFESPPPVSAVISAAPAADMTPIAAATPSWALSAFMLPDNSNKWKCSTCWVMNDNSTFKCPCCWTARPGEKPAETIQAPALPPIFARPALRHGSTTATKALPSIYSVPGITVTAAATSAMTSMSMRMDIDSPAYASSSSQAARALPSLSSAPGSTATTTSVPMGMDIDSPAYASSSTPVYPTGQQRAPQVIVAATSVPAVPIPTPVYPMGQQRAVPAVPIPTPVYPMGQQRAVPAVPMYAPVYPMGQQRAVPAAPIYAPVYPMGQQRAVPAVPIYAPVYPMGQQRTVPAVPMPFVHQSMIYGPPPAPVPPIQASMTTPFNSTVINANATGVNANTMGSKDNSNKDDGNKNNGNRNDSHENNGKIADDNKVDGSKENSSNTGCMNSLNNNATGTSSGPDDSEATDLNDLINNMTNMGLRCCKADTNAKPFNSNRDDGKKDDDNKVDGSKNSCGKDDRSNDNNSYDNSSNAGGMNSLNSNTTGTSSGSDDDETTDLNDLIGNITNMGLSCCKADTNAKPFNSNRDDGKKDDDNKVDDSKNNRGKDNGSKDNNSNDNSSNAGGMNSLNSSTTGTSSGSDDDETTDLNDLIGNITNMGLSCCKADTNAKKTEVDSKKTEAGSSSSSSSRPRRPRADDWF
ncbi:hypothetical protein BGX28_006213 [Mortierella sp. GBA30]|nr:hypothetical protein BGX28_006213 [Mortierella sp. GBA30]